MEGRKTENRTPDTDAAVIPGIPPHFEAAGVRLYQGDSLRLLPQLPAGTVDVVIADPPYCSGAMTTAGRTADPRTKYCQNGNARGRPTFAGDARDQRSYVCWCTQWLSLCLAAAKPSAYCLVFIDWRMLPVMSDALQAAGWIWRGVAAWDKGRGARSPHKGYIRTQCEYIVWGTNGPVPRPTHGGPFDGCYHESVKPSDKFHMTGKPTRLLEQLVQIAPPGGLILDPFAGSSTTGVAARRQGRQFIGIEQSLAYCDVSATRLQAA